ncbi:AMP-binding protein [Synechococcus sp. MIT S9452]|uniref:AMP-binding protein n=1 Tax=Synechococcus sp. MIT S9452 TaxID=3082546 RepID=UPI0039A4F341
MNRWELRASALEHEAGRQAMACCQQWPEGSGVVIGSGGSSGGRKWCLQSWENLEQSARSCANWLQAIGVDPSSVRLVNPLPSHHMGGLMPQIRAQHWQAPLVAIAPELMKSASALLEQHGHLTRSGRDAVISLVPTQLQRLLSDPSGRSWLQQFRLLWIGGGPLSQELADQARQLQLPLSPCYGSTETAAMVCSADPAQFLVGHNSCGEPLSDVELQLEPTSGAVAIKTKRLSPGWLKGEQVQPFADAGGWWQSGDAGRLGPAGLELLGRLDGALNSGGATVFPEQIEAALAGLAGVEALLVVGLPDPQWGQRLIGLIKPSPGANADEVMAQLLQRSAGLPPAQRPKQWQLCPELAPNTQGKWERQRWQRWAQD